jgi:hypothetical protein
LKEIYKSFERTDISYKTIIKTLSLVLTIIIKRENYKEGLYSLNPILRKLVE